MALKTFVKISKVNNLSDARYCAGMGVDMIGFSLDENDPDYVDAAKFTEISEWLSGVEFVGEFQAPAGNDISKKLSTHSINYVELDTTEHIDELKRHGQRVILRWPLANVNALPFNLAVDYLLLESPSPPSAEELDDIKQRASRVKVLLASGIQDTNVEELIKTTGAYGIALTAGHEIKPGYKDFDELADILEVLETE